MFRLGLTGSIGTGKSTTAAMFRAAGVPVHDADATVHRLYSGKAAPLIEAAFPGTVEAGVVNRKALGAIVTGHSERLKALESIVHPLVHAEESAAIDAAKASGQRLVILDIPLLFETGGEARCDAVLVVTVSPEEQKRRVLARPGMNEALFHAILARQMPSREKCRRAHAIIDTGHGLAAAQRDVEALLRALAGVI
jgi:dephospho-CoA kinase